MGVGLAVIVVEMALIHPHQIIYFNSLMDRSMSEGLHTRYDPDGFGSSHWEALEYLFERYPSGEIRLNTGVRTGANLRIFPQEERQRTSLHHDRPTMLVDMKPMEVSSLYPFVYNRKVFNNSDVAVIEIGTYVAER